MEEEKKIQKLLPIVLLSLSAILLLMSYFIDKQKGNVNINPPTEYVVTVDTIPFFDTVTVEIPQQCLCNEDVYSHFIGIPVSHISYWDSLRVENKSNIWGLNNNPFMMGDQKQRPSLMDSSSNGIAVYKNKRRAFADLILWYNWNPPADTETVYQYLHRRNAVSD